MTKEEVQAEFPIGARIIGYRKGASTPVRNLIDSDSIVRVSGYYLDPYSEESPWRVEISVNGDIFNSYALVPQNYFIEKSDDIILDRLLR